MMVVSGGGEGVPVVFRASRGNDGAPADLVLQVGGEVGDGELAGALAADDTVGHLVGAWVNGSGLEEERAALLQQGGAGVSLKLGEGKFLNPAFFKNLLILIDPNPPSSAHP